jgi:hypothetical protein
MCYCCVAADAAANALVWCCRYVMYDTRILNKQKVYASTQRAFMWCQTLFFSLFFFSSFSIRLGTFAHSLSLSVYDSRIHRIKIRFVRQYAHHTHIPNTRGYNFCRKKFIPQNASSLFYAFLFFVVATLFLFLFHVRYVLWNCTYKMCIWKWQNRLQL